MESQINETDMALYHLNFIGNHIRHYIKAFENIIDKVDIQSENVIYLVTNSYIIIQANSFLDEYNNIKSDNEEMMNVIITAKKIVKPAIKVISEWKELRDFRNQVLTHNLRNNKRKNESVFVRGLSSFDVPQNAIEMQVLLACIGMIHDVFNSAFRRNIEFVQIALDKEDSKRAAREVRYTTDNFQAIINSVQMQINKNITDVQKGLP